MTDTTTTDETTTDTTDRTEYVTWVAGECLYRGASLEAAARAWDAATYRGPAPAGGVAVQTWTGGCMVRDGWVLHVTDDGRVYLATSIRA